MSSIRSFFKPTFIPLAMLASVFSPVLLAAEADLTRHLDNYQRTLSWNNQYKTEFFKTDGSAYLEVSTSGSNFNASAGDDMMATKVGMLESQGIKMVSPGAPCCSGADSTGGIVLWHGPDGMLLETGGAFAPQKITANNTGPAHNLWVAPEQLYSEPAISISEIEGSTQG